MELDPHLHYELVAHTGLYHSRQQGQAPTEEASAPIVRIPVIIAPVDRSHIEVSINIAPNGYSVTLAKDAGHPSTHPPNR